MDRWPLTAWVMALALPHLPLLADSLQQGQDFCQAQQAAGEYGCHLQPCPCNTDEPLLQRFEEPAGGPALCACGAPLMSPHRIRQQAVEACDEFRRSQRQSCFISRGDCPRGFEALADFSDDLGNRFTACRDSRHEQSRRTPQDLRGLPKQQLLQQYDQLIHSLDSARLGPARSLPDRVIGQLAPLFHGRPLGELALIDTRALSRGCFSDCDRIYCAADGQITRWTDPDRPLVTRSLLHQIAHFERCEREGGRERFVSNWFEHLPDDVYRQLSSGQPIDADRAHFAMYMESHASNRAESLCRQLPGCRME